MPEITSESLAELFRTGPVESLRIERPVATADTRYLGAVGLSLTQPVFSSILGFPSGGMLSDDARFWVWPIRVAVEGRDGLAAIFRQFESSPYQSTPEDLIAGWVPPEDALRLE